MRADNSYYDLLASEARLASFVAIAKGDVPQEHWFRLGPSINGASSGGRALISWTGTMFEYLMPLLVMRNYDETLSRSNLSRSRWNGKLNTDWNAACPGAFLSRPTTRAICS